MSKLERFIKVQENSFERALSEIENGKKVTHWMWYIFPQIKGLGKSYNSIFYGIDSKIEASKYLSHEVLGLRLKVCTEALMTHADKTAYEVLGGVDSMKLKSSMTLFSEVSNEACFEKLLGTFFNGAKCQRTLGLIQNN
ncbi:DUF1810 domain-containing protein [Schleiferiaceae bacterium]|nr:DUF1810 domain-containing protein [Schleiferiaceae bacterium]